MKNTFHFLLMLACVAGLNNACSEEKDVPESALHEFAQNKAQTTDQKASKLDTTLTFPSEDGLPVTADVHISHALSAPFIVLFHQARWSRGEYGEIIPKLAGLGFNCMAVDQRSGGIVNGVPNETHKRASEAGLTTTYLDAYRDMKAAVHFAQENYARGKLVVWGSSYSAALAIKLASELHDRIDGVLAFAPGEYFGRFGVGDDYITQAARQVTCPVFMTSAKEERNNWMPIFQAIPGAQKHSFLPRTPGNHGSRALWSKFEDGDDYWDVVESFLGRYFGKAGG